MTKLFKLLFMSILFSYSSVCFATAKEEYDELNWYILSPINTHFSTDSSSTKIKSCELIKKQTDSGRKLSKEEAVAYTNRCTPCRIKTDLWANLLKWKRGSIEPTASWAGNAAYLSWKWKTANCSEYSRLVMLAFDFNQLNHVKKEIPFKFKQAMYLFPVIGTADHVFVLIEGVSGAMFAVDAWNNQVAPLDSSFNNLFNSPVDEDGNIFLTPELNKKLNTLFKTTNGYYDEAFVNEDSQWRLSVVGSQMVHGYVNKQNANMKDFYDNAQPAFPEWILNYEDLYK